MGDEIANGDAKMNMRRHIFHASSRSVAKHPLGGRLPFYVLLFLLLTGCSTIPRFWERGDTSDTLAPTQTLQPTPTATVAPTLSAPQTTTLKIWLPPQFDPSADTPEAKLLQARLDAFTSRRPRVEVVVRVKALTGPGGILASLKASQAAAPLALPDLVLLSRPLLEETAEDGLIVALDEMTNAMEDENWYDCARQLSQYDGAVMGLPFAGDVMLMAYRPAVIEEPPTNWEVILNSEEIFIFPAADKEAMATFALYYGAGGEFVMEEGALIFDEAVFTEVFSFFHQGVVAEVMPYWLTQFETEDQAWEAYETEQAQMALVWVSKYLSSPTTGTAFTAIPIQAESAFTIADGWLWGLVSDDPERQALSVELAEFLTANDFMMAWTSQAGYVPLRPNALDAWTEDDAWAILDQTLQNAQVIPSQYVLNALGPSVRDAVISVLKDQVSPEEAILMLSGDEGAK